MQYSKLYSITQKEIPKDATIISHQLMIRAGYIKKLSSGLYTWMPLGLRVINKVANIIRQEMEKIGFSEIQMPMIQPAKLWQETARWDKYGPLLLKMQDRHNKEYCFGPTHEEIVTDVIRSDLNTYKQLPIQVFQINTKFRDEIRPRYGVMRAREFMMKDGYSFNADPESLQQTYDNIKQAYFNMFNTMGLHVKAVLADTGDIGGDNSHEFHVLANAGEDSICFSNESSFAANLELCPIIQPKHIEQEPTQKLQVVSTKEQNITLDNNKLTQTIMVQGSNGSPVMLILSNQHTLNTVKAEKHPQIAKPLTIITNKIAKQQNINSKYLGPKQSKYPVIIDESISHLNNLIIGNNSEDSMLINVNWQRDITQFSSYDLRNAVAGDLSPDGVGILEIKKGIEVGHIFQLDDNYTKPMQVTYINDQNKNTTPLMGCYGIGVSRIVAAAIEQSHDEHGIIWPDAIAPFQLTIIPIDYHKNEEIFNKTNELYEKLAKKYDILLDDRELGPGIKFKDNDLLGIPHRLVLSPKLLQKQQVEYKKRSSDQAIIMPINQLSQYLQEAIRTN